MDPRDSRTTQSTAVRVCVWPGRSGGDGSCYWERQNPKGGSEEDGRGGSGTEKVEWYTEEPFPDVYRLYSCLYFCVDALMQLISMSDLTEFSHLRDQSIKTCSNPVP